MEQSIIARRDRRAGRIVLNRPKALNALDVDMIHEIDAALAEWRDDPAVHLVVIESSTDRAFCAGGDVRTVRNWVLEGAHDRVNAFFVHEYALNRVIARYPKPYVAIIDGIWMGGGVGLAVHGSTRIVCEHAQFAMPEVQLGLFPDIGASYVLPRLRGHFGMYLGLTGARLGGADSCWVGLATHFVPRASLAGLGDALAGSGMGVLSERAEVPGAGELAAIEDAVNAVFGADDLSTIMSKLEAIRDPWAETALTTMRKGSPASLAATFDLIRAGADRTLEQCQRAELLLTRVVTAHPDFAEGVRAMVVDKDRTPRWASV